MSKEPTLITPQSAMRNGRPTALVGRLCQDSDCTSDPDSPHRNHGMRLIPLKISHSILICLIIAMLGVGSSLAWSDSNTSVSKKAGDGKASFEYLGSFGGAVKHKVRHGNLGVVSMGSCIEILDCSDPAHPKRLARRWMEGRVTSLDFAGKALYLAVKNGGIRILDISDPTKPKERGYYDPYEMIERLYYYEVEIRNKTLLINGYYGKSYTSIEAVDISDSWHPKKMAAIGNSGNGSDEQTEAEKEVYQLAGKVKPHEEEKLDYESPYKDVGQIIPVTDNFGCIFMDGQLSTIDLGDPDNPKITGSIALQKGTAIARDKTVIVSNTQGIHFVDINDPSKPVLVSTIPTTDTLEIFDVDWPRALVTGKDKDLTVYDLADLKRPRLASHLTLSHPCKALALANQRAYVACMDLQIINLTDLAHPQLEGIVRCEKPDYAEDAKTYEGFRARDVSLCGQYAYCETSCVDISNPQIPKIIGLGEFTPPWDIGPNVYVRGSQMQAFGHWGVQSIDSNDHDEENVSTEMNIYDLSDPVKPQQVYSLEGLDEGAEIVGDRLYLHSEMSGVIALKLKPKEGPKESGNAKNVADAPRFVDLMENSKNRSDFIGLKQIKIAGELACGRLGDRTLLTIDLSTPTQPRLMGRCELPGPFASMAIDGKNLFAGGTDGTIYNMDLSNPTSPVQRTTIKLGETPQAMAASNGRLYVATNQLHIIDISLPEKMSALGTYTPAYPCTDLATSGTMVYLAAQGLEIVDTANPAAPRLRHRFPSFPNLGDRDLPYTYGEEGTSTQEVKRLGNMVYLIGISSAEVTKCQMLAFDVTNPDKSEGCGQEINATGENIDLKPQPEAIESKAKAKTTTKFGGWLIGLPVKTRAVDADRAGMMFYDCSDPSRPIFMGSYVGLANPVKPVLHKNLVYLTDDKLGLVILKSDRPSAKVR